MKKKLKPTPWQFLNQYKFIIGVVILATLLRTWNLNSQMIFFGDAGRDLAVAVNSVQTTQLPLLGIPSSVPRFHQGPLTIWMEMLVYLFFGHHLLAFGLFFAALSILAVILLFELLAIYTDQKTAVVSAFLLSVFPLAVANGRTPYHTTPIPLFLILYFFGLLQLWQAKKNGLFWAVLTFCLLFQFELATLPLSLLILYTLWRQHQFKFFKRKKIWLEILAGLGLGLLPQIVYDLTHHFTHMGGFAVWVVYRIVSFFGYKNTHVFSGQQFLSVLSSFQTYLVRTWAAENKVVFFILLILLFWGIGTILLCLKRKQKLPVVIELATIATLLQSIAYLVHGAPSEAYFPPFFILTAIILGYTIAQWLHPQQFLGSMMIGFLLCLYGFLNSWQIVQHRFFTDTNYEFNYGYGSGEQRQVVSLITRHTNGHLVLRTTQPEGKFPSYFDNLRWFLADKKIQEDLNNGEVVFVEPKKSDFPKIVNYLMVPFSSVDVYFLDKSS